MTDLIEFAARGAVRANDPFARHGIEHLSPSSISKFAADPALWVLEKLLGHRSQVGPRAHCGHGVEAGIQHGLMTGTGRALAEILPECVDEALREFEKRSVFCADGSKKDKERDAIPGMVAMGLEELLPYGPPSGYQIKISHDTEGLAVPIIGFVDFMWDNHGLLTDLKTIHAVPSQVKRAHAMQGSLYAACRGNCEARISYVSGKKRATYRIDNAAEHLKALENGARAIQRFLAVSDDPRELAGILVPDIDAYYYNDPATRQAAFEVYGV